jgi:hypothetical protein
MVNEMLTEAKLEKLVKPFIGESRAVDTKDFGKARVVTFHDTGYVHANTRTAIENKTLSHFRKAGYSQASHPKNPGDYNFFLVAEDADDEGNEIGSLELYYFPL